MSDRDGNTSETRRQRSIATWIWLYPTLFR